MHRHPDAAALHAGGLSREQTGGPLPAGPLRPAPRPRAPALSSAATIDLSVVLVNYNTAALLERAVGALRRAAARLTLQVIVVDNDSRDASLQVLAERLADCELIANSRNVGFGRANNQALPLLRGRYLLLLNTDAFVADDTLDRTLAYMEAHPECGVLGARLVAEDGTPQPACCRFPTVWNTFLATSGLVRWFPPVPMMDATPPGGGVQQKPRPCDWVPGCYYLVRREVLEQVGLFDPRYFLYFEEVDHCRAVRRAGWQVVYYPGTTVVHVGGESARTDGELTPQRQISALEIESGLLYFRKHHGALGVWASVLLAGVADAVQAARTLLKRRGLPGAAAHLAHFGAVCRLFGRTGFGRVPTR